MPPVGHPHTDTEQGGFEPPAPCGAAVFKTATIDHSDIAPDNISIIQKRKIYVKLLNKNFSDSKLQRSMTVGNSYRTEKSKREWKGNST